MIMLSKKKKGKKGKKEESLKGRGQI